MSSPAREREKRLARIAERQAAEAEYLANGGRKVCGTCVSGARCPVGPDDVMPCWVWDGRG